MTADADGVFTCRRCGACCEGQGGIVVSPADMQRLAACLCLPPEAVAGRFCERSGGKLKIRSGADGRCVFFHAEQGCAVHAGKPAICRAWPFFRGNLRDPVSLDMARSFCPGIARHVDHATFARAGLSYLREQGLLAKDAAHEANALILD